MPPHDLKRSRDERGFTLVELLVVVVIIGVLIAIAIPLYANYKRGANDRSAASDLRNAISTLERCYGDNNNAYPLTSAVSFAGNTATPCTNQTIVKGSGTTLNYLGSASGFELQAYAAGGNTSATSYWCYTSVKGGSVKQSTNTFSTSYDSTFTC